MSGGGSTLERNVALLLRRSYVPALPRQGFRTELERAWIARVRANAARERGSRWSIGHLAFAAAAALVMALLWFGGRPAPDSTPDHPVGARELLARGLVALRAAERPWRAATGAELTAGLPLAAEEVEVRLPRGAALEVIAARGRALVRGPATLRAWSEDSARAQLTSGRFELEVPGVAGVLGAEDEAPAWRVTTLGGTLWLPAGRAEVERRAELERIAMREGRARWVPDRAGLQPVELVQGSVLELSSGRPVATGSPGSTELTARRTPDGGARERGAGDTPAASSEALPPVASGSLSGRVTDARGVPLPSFRVGLLQERVGNDWRAAETRDFSSADGTFLWEHVPAGPCEVFVGAPQHALASAGKHTLGPGLPGVALELRLLRGGTVRGHVVDARTGLGIADACVVSEVDTPQHVLPYRDPDRLLWAPASTRTRSDGSFVLAHLSAGTHSLRVTAAGYAPTWTETVLVTEGDESGGLLAELAPGGSIEGRVAHDDGSDWPDALVVAASMDLSAHPQNNYGSTRTDSRGRYRIDDLPVEPVITVLVGDGSGPPRVKPVDLRSGRVRRVDFLEASEGIRLTGRVLGPGGEPAAQLNLALFDAGLPFEGSERSDFEATTTNAQGRYAFDGLRPGSYLVFRVEDMGRWIRLVDEVEVFVGAEAAHDVVLPACGLRGRLLDGRNGEPLGPADLLLRRLEPDGGTRFAGNVTSAADGTFELGGVRPGRYVLWAYPRPSGAAGMLAFQRSAEVQLSEQAPWGEVELQLLEDATLDLTVHGADGAPVSDAKLRLSDAGGNVHDFVHGGSEPPGRYRIAVPGGRYSVRATAGELASPPLSIEAASGDRIGATLTLGRAPDTDGGSGPAAREPGAEAQTRGTRQ